MKPYLSAVHTPTFARLPRPTTGFLVAIALCLPQIAPAASTTTLQGDESPRNDRPAAMTGAEPRAALDRPSPTLDAYRRGEALVRRALEALGGFERLEAAGGLTVEGSGTLDLTTMMQGTDPERPDRVPVEEWLAVDLAGGRVGYETHGKVNPDAEEWIRYVYDDSGRLLIVLRRSEEAFWVPGDDDHRRRYQRINARRR